MMMTKLENLIIGRLAVEDWPWVRIADRIADLVPVCRLQGRRPIVVFP
jgi:hypothetical protein